MRDKPVVLILAAGKGERFTASGGGEHKLAARLAGTSVLDHVIQAVASSGLAMHVVRHSPGQGGMGDSIAAGVRETAHAAGWLILPGDLPLIRPTSLQHVSAGMMVKTIVVPHYRQQQGHPVAFRYDCFDALSALTGDEGARAVVKAYRQRDQVLDLVLDDPGIVTDVDTVEDLVAAEKAMAQHK